jgi:hypothetical protein
MKTALKIIPLVLVLSACASSSGATGNPFDETAAGRNEIRVLVQNGNFYDARIYILADGVRRYLGAVGGKTDGVFTMPLAFPQEMRIQIDLLTGGDCTTEALPVDPGDTLQLQILPDPMASQLCR